MRNEHGGSAGHWANTVSADGRMAYQVVQQLVTDGSDHLEGLLGRYRVHQHIAMDANEVLACHDTVLILYITR